MENILEQCGITCQSDALVGCLTAVHKEFRHDLNIERRQEIMDRLSSHPIFPTASVWIEHNLWSHIGQRPSVWVTLSVMALLCQSVTEIRGLIRTVTSRPSMFGEIGGDVSECFYCLSVLFLICHRKFNISPRLHYNFFSAVTLSESLPPKPSGKHEAFPQLSNSCLSED